MNYAFPKVSLFEGHLVNFLSTYGSHSLAYHSLQEDNLCFYSDYGYLAYREIQNETIVLGDPIVKDADNSKLVAQFLKFRPKCSFIQISPETSAILTQNNFSINYFGVESQIDLPMHISGKAKKDIRLLKNSAIRNNIRVKEIMNQNQLYALTQNNRYSFGLQSKEYSFLSRPMVQKDEKDVRIFGGFQNGELICYSLFDPMYDDHTIIGYSESITRQLSNAPKGSRTYTLLQAMNQFANENKKFVNIGLLPFYPKGKSKDNSEFKSNKKVEFIFSQLYASSPIISNFAGLSFHKSRYRGNLLPKYFATNSNRPLKALACIYKLTTGYWLPKFLRV